MIANLARELLYWKWRLDGHVGPQLAATGPERLTVVIPAYHARRSRNIDGIVRACLRCAFVSRVVVSNHNPDVRMREVVTARDPRVQIIEQGVRRGCGHAWNVIAEQPGDYFLVIDDDQLIAPSQVGRLFEALVAQPEVPHGLCGGRGGGQYLERCEDDVEVLYNVYAVTRAHVARFHDVSRALVATGGITPEEIEYACDDLVISRAGAGPARIHDAGFVLRCRTGGATGVAIFREDGFHDRRARVDAALRALGV